MCKHWEIFIFPPKIYVSLYPIFLTHMPPPTSPTKAEMAYLPRNVTDAAPLLTLLLRADRK